jgi:hypothetical protein
MKLLPHGFNVRIEHFLWQRGLTIPTARSQISYQSFRGGPIIRGEAQKEAALITLDQTLQIYSIDTMWAKE